MTHGHFKRGFLGSRFIVSDVISTVGPRGNRTVIRVNPNLTTLARPINRHLSRLAIVRLSHSLTTHLRARPFLNPGLAVCRRSTVAFGFNRLTRGVNRPLHIFNGLPCGVSAPLVFRLFDCASTVTSVRFVLRGRIIGHLITKPGDGTCNQLDIVTRCCYGIVPILRMPPSTFAPPPGISSTIIHLIPRTAVPRPIGSIHILDHVAARTFGRHHGAVHGDLNGLFDIRILAKVKVSPTVQTRGVSITRCYRVTGCLTRGTPLRRDWQ